MRNWIFILIFSSLLGNMNAHQVQLVTHHEKTNGVLIRVVVSNVPEVDDIAGWVGQENWFYLTLNEAVFAENVLENLKASSPILEIEGIQNQQSVQIGFLMENYISDFEIFHSPSNRVFLIHLWHELDVDNIADIKSSEKNNNNKIFSISDQNLKGRPFYDSFIDAREKYGPEKYFVWYNNWYSTEDKLDFDGRGNKKIKNEADIWEKHWSGNSLSKENTAYGPKLPYNSQQSNNANEVAIINKEPTKPVNKPKTVVINDNSQEKIKRIEEQILKRKNASSKKDKIVSSDKKVPEKQKVKPRRVIKKSSEDLQHMQLNLILTIGKLI